MAISRLSTSRLTQGLPKYQSAWDGDTEQGAIVPIAYADGRDADMEFTNIPQTYQDLMLIINVRDKLIAGPRTSIYFGANGSATVGDYIWTSMYGDGSSMTADRSSTNQWSAAGVPGYNATAGEYSTVIIHLLDYKNTNKFKTMLQRSAEDSAGSGIVSLHHGLWKQTAAISSLQLRNTFQTGSKVTLYGIKGGL